MKRRSLNAENLGMLLIVHQNSAFYNHDHWIWKKKCILSEFRFSFDFENRNFEVFLSISISKIEIKKSFDFEKFRFRKIFWPSEISFFGFGKFFDPPKFRFSILLFSVIEPIPLVQNDENEFYILFFEWNKEFESY